ncbi:hypothetical protein GCM10027598_82560 [Amycolatopsis oliviviridis]|uniref:Uncharacterized protein n=1 Tax=Amycolatopsis oliviviridis TaxID=1471590 RepID=A0ABQ3L659_9PSEU|nr:DUF6506 family protein [Amycolatopsis oliviviridis]GHH06676.1 hypothetical protein GCM10017790_12460 [Amycolatopsis oliviviridis]
MSETIELFLFLEPGADPDTDRVVQDLGDAEALLVWVPDGAAAAKLADEAVAAGVQLMELYRGFDLASAAQVIEAVDGRAAVGVAGFGIPATQPIRDSATIFVGHPSADPARHRVVREHAGGGRTTAVSVPDSPTAVRIARELADAGTGLIEICGGTSLIVARDVATAVGDRVPVRLVTWPVDSIEPAAAYKAAFEAETAQETP